MIKKYVRLAIVLVGMILGYLCCMVSLDPYYEQDEFLFSWFYEKVEMSAVGFLFVLIGLRCAISPNTRQSIDQAIFSHFIWYFVLLMGYGLVLSPIVAVLVHSMSYQVSTENTFITYTAALLFSFFTLFFYPSSSDKKASTTSLIASEIGLGAISLVFVFAALSVRIALQPEENISGYVNSVRYIDNHKLAWVDSNKLSIWNFADPAGFKSLPIPRGNYNRFWLKNDSCADKSQRQLLLKGIRPRYLQVPGFEKDESTPILDPGLEGLKEKVVELGFFKSIEEIPDEIALFDLNDDLCVNDGIYTLKNRRNGFFKVKDLT